jgi:hypothetical protein
MRARARGQFLAPELLGVRVETRSVVTALPDQPDHAIGRHIGITGARILPRYEPLPELHLDRFFAHRTDRSLVDITGSGHVDR